MVRSPAICRLVVSGALLLTALTAGASIARAQTALTWSSDGATPGSGGTGTWDATSAALWFDGTSFVPWTNSTFNDALFGGTAGTVTVSGTIDVHNITFNTGGYTIGGGTLRLGGSAPTISGSGTIASTIIGTAGLVFAGGTLTLGGANTFTGAVNIAAGTVVLGNNAALGATAGGTTIAAGATLDLNNKSIRGEPIILDGGTIANSATAGADIGSLLVNGNSFLTPGPGDINIQRTSGAGSLTISSTSDRVVWSNWIGPQWAHTGGTILNSGRIDLYGPSVLTGGPLTINGGTFNTLNVLGGGGQIGANVAVTVNGGTWQLYGPETIGSLAGTGGSVQLNGHALSVGGSGASTAYSGIITGTGGFAKIGTGTLLLSGPNTYTGPTTVSGGVLATSLLANGGSTSGIGRSSSAAGNLVLDGGTLQYTGAAASTNRLFTLTTNGGGLDASGTGPLTYGNTGTIALSGSGARNLILTGTNTGANTLASVLADGGGPTSLTKSGTGTWVLTGTNTYTGGTNVTGGRLVINGDQSGATGTVSVTSGGTLNGTGTIGGTVVIADGATFAPGNPLAPGTLTINGDLALGSGAIVSYQLGQPFAGSALNDLAVVRGNLTLDGTLNVTTTAGGSFDPGIYRLFEYAGVLTNNGLTVGSVPTSDYFLQTAVPNQINLINTSGLAMDFWDGGDPTKRNNGVIDGGNGAWQSSAGLGNWTTLTGTPNAAWNDGAFAVFEGTAGTVTVDNSLGQVVAEGLDFASSGYVITGEALTLTETTAGTGQTTIRVGDGSATGASSTATVAAVLQGSTQLVKADLGRLILNGANTYTGGTVINGGTLQVASDANLGAAAGSLNLNGGTLATTATFSTARATTLNASGGTFDVANATTLTMSGAIGGAGALTKINTGALVLTGANSYSGGTTIAAGTLQIGGGGTSGSLAGNVTNNGTLAFNRSDTVTYGGVISGTGSINQVGAGTTVLTGTNTYTGGTTISAGTLQVGSGTINGSIIGNVTNNSVLAFNPATGTIMSFGGVISGTGAVNHTGTGATILTGANTYSGGTNVNAGTLYINGNQSAATGTVSVASGATLGGQGTIGGSVNVASGGTFSPGNGLPGTLTINGHLTLSSGSTLNYQLGQPGVISGAHNDLTVVNGNLTLDGTLNVTTPSGGSFEPGIYRLFNYGGTLTNNGLVVGTVPTPDFFLQTAVPNQINLINTAGLLLNFWDGGDLTKRNNGVIDGGNGVWQSSASALGNWTTLNGTPNSPWNDGAFAIFEGTAGTVTVDNSLGQVVASGLDFATSGYTIDGGPITLTETNAGTGRTTIRVGDDTAAGAGEIVTIASVLQGNVQLVKTDLGTLILSGANTYTGGSAINGGTLQVASDANLGAAAGALSFEGGTLATTASFSSARATTLNAEGGTFDVANATALTMSGAIGGAGALTKINTGALVLTGANTYGGGTTIAAGTLQLGGGGTSGSLAGNITNNGTLAFNRSDTATYGGVISGTGAVNQAGAGTTVLTGTNTYSGGTAIAAGTLQLGNGTTNGSIVGNVANNSVLAFNPATGTTMTFDGVISGTGAVNQTGTGITVLTGTNTYSGGTAINGGTLQVENGGNLGAVAGALSFNGGTLATTSSFSSARSTTLNAGGGTFDVSGGTMLTLTGAIGGTGTLSVTNTGTLVLSGTNTYTGATNVTSGRLLVQGDQSAATGSVSVASRATLGGSGSIGGAVTIGNGGTLAPGNSAGTLTVGALTLDAGSILDYELATPNIVGGGVNDLIVVAGGLTLAGTLNVSALSGFGAGSYRLMNYGGTFIDNGLEFGVLPSAFAYGLDTATGGQVNLTVTNPVSSPIQYWDGSHTVGDGVVNGGSGVWSTATNWTDANGTMNQAWGGQTAVFSGASGTVTVVGSTAFDGLQFLTDGYSLVAGAGAELTTSTPGTAVLLSPGVEATDAVPITGTGGIDIQGGGTFVTTANNGYTGGTTIASGSTLQLGNGGTSGSIVGDVTNDGTLVFSRADTVSFSGTISGTGHVTQSGPGTLVLTGTNSYAGGTTIARASTLQLGNGGTSGSIVGDVTDDGTLIFNRADTVSFGSTISGTGHVTQNGPGTLVLTGTNSYAGGTTIAPASTLQLGNGGTSGGIVGDVTDNGTLVFNRADRVSFGGAITGTGHVTQNGPGTLVLTGTNSYAGGTTIAAGSTLQLGNGGTSGSILGDVTDDGTLVFNRADAVSFGGTISGTGHLTQRGPGPLVLTATNTYAGGTTIARASTLQLGNGGTSGSIVGDVTDDGTLVFNRADTVSFGGTISGTGNIKQNGQSTLVLTGSNSYAGGTTFNAGIVSVSRDANLGAASGSLTFNGGTLHTTADISAARSTTIAGSSGTIDTDAQTTFSLSGAISGPGGLVKIGAGRLLLSGSNTYSGGTLVSAGTLQGNTDSLQGTIIDNAALFFDQDNDGTFRGTLFGTGTLTKRGAGLVRLTGDHGLQGLTSVLAGTLELNGSLAGSVTVARGATFSGTGVIGGTLSSLGTVVVGASGAATSLNQVSGSLNHSDGLAAASLQAPGGTGVLGVVGDITLSPGSQLHVGIDAAAGHAGLVTDGRASIDGAVVVHAQKDGFSRATHYAIVGARNGLSGLATATSTSTSLEPYLSRDPNTLFVTLLRTDIPLQSYAVTGNGWAAAGAFDRIRATATGDLLDITRQLTALDDPQLGSALDAVSGEIHASQTHLVAIDGESVMDVTRSEVSSRITWRDRVKEGAQGSRASLWGYDRLRPWIRVRSDRGSFDAGSPTAGQGDRPGAHGADTMLDGVVGGVDWSFANDWLAGVGGSYVDGKMTINDLNEQSSFRAPRVLGYLGYARDRWVIDTGLSVAHTSYDVTRRFGFAAIAPTGQPLFGTVEREARSTPAGTASELWVEGRYNTPIGSWDLQPRIGLRAAWYRLGDWNETGADSLSLSAAADTNSSVQGDIGLRTSRAIGKLRPFLEGMYRRELSSGVLNTTIALTDQPDGLFEVEGFSLTPDTFVGRVGTLFLTDHVGLSVHYELHYAGTQTRHGFQLGVGF